MAFQPLKPALTKVITAAPKPVPAPAAKPEPVVAGQGYPTKDTFVPQAAALTAAPVETAAPTLTATMGKVMQGVAGLMVRAATSVKEAVAVAALPPDQRAEYQQTKAAMKDDPEAQKALQQALFDGKLTQKGPDGKTTLDSLARMADPAATTPVGDTTPAQVLAQTVKDIANPGAMSQGEDNALCGPVSVMQQKASTDPAGYAAAMAGLTLDGQCTIPHDGADVTLHLQPSFAVDGSRSPTEQIMGVALLNPSGGSQYITDNKGYSRPTAERIHFLEINGAEPDPMFGSTAGDQAWMQYALLGGNYEGQKIPDGDQHDAGVAAAKTTLQDQVGKGQQVSVLLSPTDGSGMGHWVTVTGVDKSANTVTYVDGAGQTHTENLDAFLGGTTQGADGQPAHAPVESLTFNKNISGDATPDEAFIDWRSDPGGGHKASGTASPSSDGG